MNAQKICGLLRSFCESEVSSEDKGLYDYVVLRVMSQMSPLGRVFFSSNSSAEETLKSFFISFRARPRIWKYAINNLIDDITNVLERQAEVFYSREREGTYE